jgi:hypothetical protein
VEQDEEETLKGRNYSFPDSVHSHPGRSETPY